MVDGPSLGLRRAVVLGASLAVPLLLVFGLGHRGVHMMRSVVVPGAGLAGSSNLLAAAFLIAAVAATVAWVRWGMDWVLAAVVVGAVAASGLAAESHHEVVTDALSSLGRVVEPVAGAHEFPLVLLAAALISWLRTVAGRTPGLSHLARRRGRRSDGLSSIERMKPVDRSRTAAVLALAGDTELARTIADDPSIERRARRVGRWARGRFAGDVWRIDHAHARAALVLAGPCGESEQGPGKAPVGGSDPTPSATAALRAVRLVGDSERTAVGVPCSEPTWVRPLDGTLAAIALERCGGSPDRWVNALGREFGLRRGHRSAWYWTPLGWPAGSAPAWEHATFSALARAMGWIGDGDWEALRARALGASARGVEHPHDERLIAAARIWLVFVDDERASPLLARPTVQHDPLAVALDRLATRLRSEPHALAPHSHARHPEVHA